MTQPHPQPDYDPIFNGLINYFKEMEWQRIEDDISIHEIIEILTDFAKMEKEKSATHTPAAPATEYTIEQIAEIDNRIRKERKAEREQVLDKKNITIIRKRCLHPYWETCGGLNCCQHFVEKTGDCLFDVDAFIESLRGGGAP